MKNSTSLFMGLLLACSASADQGTTIMPGRQLNLNDINYSGQAGNGIQFRVILRASCFGTNLRSVANPLSPTSQVNMTLAMTRIDGTPATFKVTFPANIVLGQAASEPRTVTVTGGAPGAQAAISGQTLMIKTPEVIKEGQRLYTLTSYSFIQEAAAGGMYMGANGSLSASVGYSYSADNSTLEISAAFPGQTGFCGGYFSPLMIFFSKDRPALNSKSDFKLRPEGESFYWPEGSENWALLAIDKNGNGKIDGGEELFGPDDKFLNGFEALAALDTNKDGKIDKKDKDFAKLKLWFDLNGDGKTDKDELRALSKKDIQSIGLKYTQDRLVSVGERGEFRERGTVETTKKSTYEIIDVWLGVQKAKTK